MEVRAKPGTVSGVAYIGNWSMTEKNFRLLPEHVLAVADSDSTVVADAARKVRLEHGPDSFRMPLSAIAIGPVALFGIPGEPFTGVGRALKEAEGFELVLPSCNTNAKEGYFPMLECYEEGGYEAGSSNFKAGVAELIIEAGINLLKDLK